MDPVDNNQFEVKPKSKRKIDTPCPNVYLNPALDLLANEDPMCNTAMEITPNKKRKRTRSEGSAFENNGLDLGISRKAVNELLVSELENVKRNIKAMEAPVKPIIEDVIPKESSINKVEEEPIYANLSTVSSISNERTKELTNQTADFLVTEDTLNQIKSENETDIEIDSGISVLEPKSINNDENVSTTNIQTNVTNQVIINNTSNLSLSFIDRLALESPATNQSLYLDDDLNESNIMEIKTITIITKKRFISNKKNTNPFLDPNLDVNIDTTAENPFLDQTMPKPELEYNLEAINRPIGNSVPLPNNIMPRKLFTNDTNSTISTVNESTFNTENHDYENIDSYRSESPIYENIGEDFTDSNYNKQSKILGHDVSQFNSTDILNINRNQSNSSNETNTSKKDLKHLLKKSNKLSKKVFKTLKKTFKGEKVDNNVTLNPYEVPRKPPKTKVVEKESGIENPGLHLDNSDEIEIEELDDEHEYETIKTLRNTRLNENVTPLRERCEDNFDISHNRTNTPGKKVRFDSTLNREKVITGNSFDCGIQSPGFDAKIDRYHDELENCINERKFLQQNM